MNTDQAFELLRDAGVTEDRSIQTVKRWLRDGKIKYEGGKGNRKNGYIIDDTDQVLDLLKDAGVTESIGIQTIRRWLHGGRMKSEGNRKIESSMDDTPSKLFTNGRMDQNTDEIIRRLKLKIQAQDKHIKGIEELHEVAKKGVLQQRDQLKREVIALKNDVNKLQNEIRDLLKQNIELRNEWRKLKESKRNKYHFTSTTQLNHKKLGLSKMADNKEVAAAYKGLLKLTHPDRGGNAKLFHYIKTDYDHFRNSIEGK
ncbi:hypothetical protein QYG89_10860 [Bacillus sp. B190/17]|uniref:J domain-containing protein n=1 Tax=Bacillus lumedeiriae TaxID=3058829 RepID=A0ABW8IB03_9BACI